MSGQRKRLGMILKGYPRISETFISTEILLLESLNLPIEIYSLRQPREDFVHRHVREIRARATYLPEYVIPHWRVLWESNRRLAGILDGHYRRCFAGAVRRAFERRKVATLRHFLQAGHLCCLRLINRPVGHLHAHFCHTPTSVALFASELSGIPFSFTAHAKDIYTSEPDQVLRKIQHARFVVTCTEYNARFLRGLAENVGCTTPIHVIYHGINLGFFSYSDPEPATPPFRILSVGRLVPKKGYECLLHALKLLNDSGVDFTFTHVGSGELKAQLKALVGALRLGDRVRMLGTLPHEEVLKHYRESHCFALASRVAPNGDRDGIPNVLVEAMATGTPVVATNVSAIPELVEDRTSGLLVPPDDPPALAAALHEVLFNASLRTACARRARNRVEEHFNNRRCVRRLHGLLKKALDSS